MAQLVQTFSGDTALRLQDEEFVRQLNVGTNWRKLRIVVHHAIVAPGGNIAPNLWIGVCQGTTNTFKSTTTTDWAGMVVGQGNWNYTAGPPGGIATGGSNPKAAIRSGNTTTLFTNPSVGCAIGTTNRDWWCCEITKITPNPLIGMRCASSTPTVDLTSANFQMLAAQETGAGVIGTSQAITYNGNYLWDCVSIYWEFAAVGYELSEVQVIRCQ